MSATEKSDLPEVAKKRANKAASAAAERVERRGGAKENAELQSTVRTQSRAAVSQAQARIREAVIRNRQDKLTALLHHLTVDVLRASFFGLKKSAAPGVDEVTWTEYAEGLEENLSDLHSRVQTGAYRALPSRRKYIPKEADGQTHANQTSGDQGTAHGNPPRRDRWARQMACSGPAGLDGLLCCADERLSDLSIPPSHDRTLAWRPDASKPKTSTYVDENEDDR